MKLRKGDTIKVTAGKDKGRTGKVEKVFSKEERVLVAGLNIYKRHLKRRDEKHPGGIVEIPRPFPLGNVALLCPSCSRPTRVGHLIAKNEKVRICRKCGKKI